MVTQALDRTTRSSWRRGCGSEGGGAFQVPQNQRMNSSKTRFHPSPLSRSPHIFPPALSLPPVRVPVQVWGNARVVDFGMF